MKIGYARISTQDQNMNLQMDALKQAGCEKIFYDRISGVKTERKGLNDALNFAREGDVLVVWKLDRLGRSLKHLIEVINNLNENGIGFASVQESIDTTTPGGKLVFHIFGAMSEFERELIRERTQAGLAAARARGRLGGRPNKMNKKDIAMARTLLADKSISVKEICKRFNVSKSTLYKNVRDEKEPEDQESRSGSLDL